MHPFRAKLEVWPEPAHAAQTARTTKRPKSTEQHKQVELGKPTSTTKPTKPHFKSKPNAFAEYIGQQVEQYKSEQRLQKLRHGTIEVDMDEVLMGTTDGRMVEGVHGPAVGDEFAPRRKRNRRQRTAGRKSRRRETDGIVLTAQG